MDEDKLKKALDEIRVRLQADGGDLELASIVGNTVNLKLKGACGCCPHATITIKNGIQQYLRDKIDPDIVVERVE